MTSEATRRKFLHLFRLAVAAGLLPPEMLFSQTIPKDSTPPIPKNSTPPNQPNQPNQQSHPSQQTDNLSRAISDIVDGHQKELEKASQEIAKTLSQPPPNNGPSIGVPSQSVRYPVFEGFEDIEGITREDVPADYTKFDRQTGLFGEEGEAALPVGF